MAEPYVVPKSMAEWDQDLTFRVEHTLDGYSQTVYFDGLGPAKAFAGYHKHHNRPCMVQVRSMPTTHRVEIFSTLEPAYVLRHQPFGDLDSARDYYNASIYELAKHTGVRLIHQDTGHKLAIWTSRTSG